MQGCTPQGRDFSSSAVTGVERGALPSLSVAFKAALLKEQLE
jgi:hypothetical protein